MEPILKIEHLSVSFTQYDRGARRRQLHVVKDLSLAVMPGQIAAVVGASGSGKSTTSPLDSTSTGCHNGSFRSSAIAIGSRQVARFPTNITLLKAFITSCFPSPSICVTSPSAPSIPYNTGGEQMYFFTCQSSPDAVY